MSQYAQDTKVSVENSEIEIRKTLKRYGADAFFSGSDEQENLAMIGFRIHSRHIKIILPLPSPDSKMFRYQGGGTGYTKGSFNRNAYEQSVRQRWRALALIVKAKLEAVESGISTVEREFLPDIVMPDGQTVYQWAQPQIEQMYLTGKMPPLLPSGVE